MNFVEHDRGMLLPKAFYLFYYAALASLAPFLVIYYDSLGLKGSKIGILVAIPPLVMLVSAPFWGGLADATRQHKKILLLCIILTLLSVLGLMFTTVFLLLIPVVAAYAFFNSPIMPIVDNSVIDLLGERRSQYGRQRVWGTIGWGVVATLIGWLTEKYGLRWFFYGYLLLMSVTLLLAWFMPVSRGSLGKRFWSGFRSLVVNRQWALFLVLACLGGMIASMLNSFLLLYLNDLHASKTLIGLSLTIATLSEMPVLFFSDHLLVRWSARSLLVAALLVYSVRALTYSFLVVPWLILLVQLLHGPTYGLFWAAGITYASEIAPPGFGATAQGVFSAVYMGLGGTLGALSGGWLYDGLGPQRMFLWSGLGLLAGTLAFFLAERLLPAPPEIVLEED